jgi:hypothetical protein
VRYLEAYLLAAMIALVGAIPASSGGTPEAAGLGVSENGTELLYRTYTGSPYKGTIDIEGYYRIVPCEAGHFCIVVDWTDSRTRHVQVNVTGPKPTTSGVPHTGRDSASGTPSRAPVSSVVTKGTLLGAGDTERTD